MITQPTNIEIKKMLIDAGLDRPGSQQVLAAAIGVNKNQLSMALTGYRKSRRSEQILNALREYLLNDQS